MIKGIGDGALSFQFRTTRLTPAVSEPGKEMLSFPAIQQLNPWAVLQLPPRRPNQESYVIMFARTLLWWAHLPPEAGENIR